MKETFGKIYLSDQRGFTETAQFQRFSTIHSGDSFHESNPPEGHLRVFNEEMIAGGQSVDFQTKSASHVILFPLTGALHCLDASGYTTVLDVGEIRILHVPEKHSFRLSNPYDSDTIHFLQIWIQAEQALETVSSQLHAYDVNALDNQLLEVVTAGNTAENGYSFLYSFSLGRLAGRQVITYSLKHQNSTFFAFLIAGALELEGRLLHEKDGLALWGDIQEVEMEALSEQALLLVLEMGRSLSSTQKLHA